MTERQQYTYTWTHGSPEDIAYLHERQGKATVDDLLLLAMVNARTADEALPPWATGPEKNNMGDAFTPDPWHASACAERAYYYARRAREMLHARALLQNETQTAGESR